MNDAVGSSSPLSINNCPLLFLLSVISSPTCKPISVYNVPNYRT